MHSKLESVLQACCSRPARCIRSLTTEYPMKDASPEERSDEGSLLSFVTPFGSCSCALFHFPYTLFSSPNSMSSIACALFRKTRGVGINSSQNGTLAPSSTNHKSRITNNSSRMRSYKKKVERWGVLWKSSHPATIGFGVGRVRLTGKRGGLCPVVG